MSSISAIALSGMNAAQTSLQVSAHNIANLDTAGFQRQQVAQTALASGGVSSSWRRSALPGDALPGDALADDVVAQLQAKNAFLANLSVFRTHDRMLGSLLDAAG